MPVPGRRLRARLLQAGLALAFAAMTPAALGQAQALRERLSQLGPALGRNDYGRPLHIASTQEGNRLRGQVHAVLDHPFDRVQGALREPQAWCGIMILPFNTKACRVEGDGSRLVVNIGRKAQQPLEDSYALDFAFAARAAQADYFEAGLEAPRGPLGTRDYRITVSAIPLEGGRTFLRLDYAYGFGMMGRIAMAGYLSTAGANKVGFSTEGVGPDGRPVRVGGLRGVVERNAMRYYLAIDAFLDALSAPPADRTDRALSAWFDATERYPDQLREMDKATYMALKRGEVARMGGR